MKIYVASSWQNKHHDAIVALLRKDDFEVFDYRNPEDGKSGFKWDDVDPNYQMWSTLDYAAGLQHEKAVQGFNADWKAMSEADACVLVLPSGRSAHLEAGYFVGARKPLLIYMPVPGERPELMYKMATTICANETDLLRWIRSIASWLTLGSGSLAAR